jgi:1,4-dihydroxy-2-naphthoate octaprenyltransferase
MLTTMMLWGNYPMTQVYQHDEDSKRGDITLSLKLGIRGTFYFTAFVFTLGVIGFVYFFTEYYAMKYGVIFLFALTPVLFFFGYWFVKVRANPENANYKNAMMLNLISATCLNAFFIFFFLDTTQVIQAIQGGY